MAYIYSKACIDAWPGNIYYAIKHEKNHMLSSEGMDHRSYFIVPVNCESDNELKALAQCPNIIWQFQVESLIPSI
jgi:hypothetical protein